MKKIISLVLSIVFLTSTSLPICNFAYGQEVDQNKNRDQDQDKDLDLDRFGGDEKFKDPADSQNQNQINDEQKDEPQDDPATFPRTQGERLIEDFSNLRHHIDELTDGLPEKWNEYSGAVYQLKYFAEKILNAPTYHWGTAPIDDYVHAIQYIFQEELLDYPKLNPDKKIFKWSDDGLSFSLDQKEAVFQLYHTTLQNLKKTAMVIHLDLVQKDSSLWRSYQLTLTSQGKKAMENFLMTSLFTIVPSGPNEYEVVGRLKEENNSELEAMAEPMNEDGWKKILKRLSIDAYIEEWVNLETLWLSKYNKSPRVPILPASCQNQYFTLPPLSILRLKNEQSQNSSRMAFNMYFLKGLIPPKDIDPKGEHLGIFIPPVVDPPTILKLITLIPQWKSQYLARLLVSPEEADKLIQAVIQPFANADNKLSRAVLSWVLHREDPQVSEWQGDENEIKERFKQAIYKTKQIIFLAEFEMFVVHDTKISPTLTRERVDQVIQLSKEMVLPLELDLDLTLEQLYSLYRKAKEIATAERRLSELNQNPIQKLNIRLESLLEQAKLAHEQDLKIEKLKNKESILPIEDTPANVKRISLLMAHEYQMSKKAISPKANEILMKILFKDPEFDGSLWNVKDGTYEAAYHKYQQWVKSASVEAPIRKEVIELCEKFRLNHFGFLNDVVSDPKVRIQYEEMVKQWHLGRDPLLKVEIENEATVQGTHIPLMTQTKFPLYQHLISAVEKNMDSIEQTRLVELAVWEKMHRAEYELDQFCKADVETTDGLRLILSNEQLQTLALDRFPDFMLIQNQILEQMHEALKEPWYQSAVGKGFLTIIAISLLSGPLSKTPWVGRFLPVFPKMFVQMTHLFGTLAAPAALYWGVQDGIDLFKTETRLWESLEHYQDLQSQATDVWNHPITFGDIVDKIENPDANREETPSLVMSPQDLNVARWSYVFFLPVQLSFAGQCLGQIHELYRFGMDLSISGVALKIPLRFGSERAAMAYSLRKLYIPTRFWTFKAGNEAIDLSSEQFRNYFISSLDDALKYPTLVQKIPKGPSLLDGMRRVFGQSNVSSVERLAFYVQKDLTVAERMLSFHETEFGVSDTWPGTESLIETQVNRKFFASARGWNAYQDEINQRKNLLIQVRLDQVALEILNQAKGKVKSLGELEFRSAFEKTLDKLGQQFDVTSLKQAMEGKELEWVVSRIELDKFWKNWFGGWVGLQGPLARAANKIVAEQYLGEIRASFERVSQGNAGGDDLLRVLRLLR